MERAILIHFNSVTGEVKVEAQGFEGLACLEATQPIEEALGVVEGDAYGGKLRSFKPEAQQQRITSNHQTQLRH